jgi:pimeloyl-ACP methyl ester carboxylesterase
MYGRLKLGMLLPVRALLLTAAWPARLAAAHTLPRELRAHEGYRFEAGRFKKLKTPTLLLLGGDSPGFFKAALEAVDAVLPDSRVVVMPGQQHSEHAHVSSAKAALDKALGISCSG